MHNLLNGLKGLTIPQMIIQSAEFYRGKTALAGFHDRTLCSLSYKELIQKMNNFAGYLINSGLVSEDKVALLSENRVEWGIAYLAVLAAGGIVIPLDTLLKPQERESILSNSQVKFIIASDKYLAELKSLQIPFVEKVIPLEKLDSLKSSKKIKLPEISDTQLAVIIYTSGTTGESKGVMLTHRNIISDIWGIHKILKLYPEDIFLSVLPLHHTFEATCGFLVPLSKGATVVYSRSLKSKDLMQDVKEHRISVMLGVPLLFEKFQLGLKRGIRKKSNAIRIWFEISFQAVKWIKKISGINLGQIAFKGLRKKAGLGSLRLLVCGGAPLPAEIAEFFNLFGIEFLQGYGLTETSPVLTVNPHHKPRYNSVGVAIPGANLKIIEKDSNGVGEIVVQGEMVTQGYYNNPPATVKSIKEDWFYTGDLGLVDKDGYYYIVGRCKNVIVSRSGKNIYPEELEKALNNHPFILESLVLARPGGIVEEVHAVIVPDWELLEQSGIKNEEEIFNLISQELKIICSQFADYKRIKSFEIRKQELDKTSTRKIKRYIFSKPIPQSVETIIQEELRSG